MQIQQKDEMRYLNIQSRNRRCYPHYGHVCVGIMSGAFSTSSVRISWNSFVGHQPVINIHKTVCVEL